MANQPSKPPTERTNFQFVSPLKTAKEDLKIPYLMVVAGDWNGRGREDKGEEDSKEFQKGNGELHERDLLVINAPSDFQKLLASQKIRLQLSIPNKLEPDKQYLDVDLKINSLEDFSPDKLAEKIPAIQKLLEQKRTLVEVRSRLGRADIERDLSTILKNADQTRQLRELLPQYTPETVEE